jgi:hypothetical protein
MVSRSTKIVVVVAAVLFVAPVTAQADDPVPTVDQVVAIMAELTDPNRPAASKSDVVTPAFTSFEAGEIDDHLHRMDGAGGILPLPFVVSDIEPAPNSFAGATLATTGSMYQTSRPKPIVLVNQNGHWLITHDTAMTAMNAFWINALHRDSGGPIVVPHAPAVVAIP